MTHNKLRRAVSDRLKDHVVDPRATRALPRPALIVADVRCLQIDGIRDCTWAFAAAGRSRIIRLADIPFDTLDHRSANGACVPLGDSGQQQREAPTRLPVVEGETGYERGRRRCPGRLMTTQEAAKARPQQGVDALVGVTPRFVGVDATGTLLRRGTLGVALHDDAAVSGAPFG